MVIVPAILRTLFQVHLPQAPERFQVERLLDVPADTSPR
jgi:hypothetical protein